MLSAISRSRSICRRCWKRSLTTANFTLNERKGDETASLLVLVGAGSAAGSRHGIDRLRCGGDDDREIGAGGAGGEAGRCGGGAVGRRAAAVLRPREPAEGHRCQDGGADGGLGAGGAERRRDAESGLRGWSLSTSSGPAGLGRPVCRGAGT